jgi:hypothetical protein
MKLVAPISSAAVFGANGVPTEAYFPRQSIRCNFEFRIGLQMAISDIPTEFIIDDDAGTSASIQGLLKSATAMSSDGSTRNSLITIGSTCSRAFEDSQRCAA